MADYTGLNRQENSYKYGVPTSKFVKSEKPSNIPQDATPKKVIAKRINPALAVRQEQIAVNLLALESGRPYVDARLSRFAAEDKVDWEGGTRKDGSCSTGRLEQAHSVPYLPRISQKIKQYTLGVDPIRDGIDPLIEKDITNTGQSLNEFMADVNDFITATGWCWIKVDSPTMPEGDVSQEMKESQKLRPYWTVYSPLSVVDWYINAFGVIEWVLTEEYDYVAIDPLKPPQLSKFRRLWQPGQVTEYKYGTDNSGKPTSKIESVEVKSLSLKSVVPFFPVGTISGKPHGFDTLESINRTIMDLESCNRQNFFECVYAQLAVPAGMIQRIKDSYEVNTDEATSMVMGFKYPIEVPDGGFAPQYIMPDSSAIKGIREELQALKFNMFESVGLMLQQESKQVASADAKAWDFLDVQQVMKERATILEDAEEKAVELSKMWDSSFKEWTPAYNKTFDISDPKADMETIVLGQQMETTPTMQKIAMRKWVDVTKRIGSGDITPEELKDALQEIADFTPATFELLPEPTMEEE